MSTSEDMPTPITPEEALAAGPPPLLTSPVDPVSADPATTIPPLEVESNQPLGSEADGAKPERSLKKTAMSAAIWIIVGSFFMLITDKIVRTVVLSHLLHPDVFGLIALISSFVTALYMLSDVGFHEAIIQSKRGDEPDFLNTAWTMQIIRGSVLWIGTLMIAWPAALMYDQPVLMWAVPVAGLETIILSFCSTALYRLDRHLSRGRRLLLDLSNALITTGVTILWAYYSPTVWAFIAGSLAGYTWQLFVSHCFLPGDRHHFHWDRTAVTELVNFSKWVLVSSLITYLAFQSDRLVVGAIAGMTKLGLYHNAAQIVGVATGLMSTLATRLVIPVYSRLIHKGRDIRTAFGAVHTAAAGIAGLLVTGMVAAGPAAVRLLCPEEYWQAGEFVQWMAIGAWAQMLEGTASASLWALGQTRSVMMGNGSRLLSMIFFIALGWGLCLLLDQEIIYGIIFGYAMADVVRYVVTTTIARRNGMSSWVYDLILTSLIVVFSPIAYKAGDWLAQQILGDASPSKVVRELLFLTCQGTPAALLWGLVFLFLWLRGHFRLREVAPQAS